MASVGGAFDRPGSAGGRTVSALTAGAVGDGRTDDTAALQRALDALTPGDVLVLPAGSTFAHADVLEVDVPGVTITGGGILLATDEERSAVRLRADRVTVTDLVLATAATTRRWSAPQQTGLWLDGHRDAVVQDVTVRDAPSAGVFVQGAQHFRLTRVTVTGTRADGIHMTGGARYGLVEQPLTEDTGDDGIAVVSYRDDPARSGDIDVESPRVLGTTGGRGLSVVGGDHVRFTDVEVRDTAAAGIYVACERAEFDTWVPSSVSVTGGSVSGANHDPAIDHGALLVYNGQQTEPLRDVAVADLRIAGTRASASRQVGLIADDDGPISGIVLSGIAITGPGPAQLLASSTDQLEYRATGWTLDGRPVADRSVRHGVR